MPCFLIRPWASATSSWGNGDLLTIKTMTTLCTLLNPVVAHDSDVNNIIAWVYQVKDLMQKWENRQRTSACTSSLLNVWTYNGSETLKSWSAPLIDLSCSSSSGISFSTCESISPISSFCCAIVGYILGNFLKVKNHADCSHQSHFLTMHDGFPLASVQVAEHPLDFL